MNCAKMAELTEMQFGMLSRLGPGNVYYMGIWMPHRKKHFWVCLAD